MAWLQLKSTIQNKVTTSPARFDAPTKRFLGHLIASMERHLITPFGDLEFLKSVICYSLQVLLEYFTFVVLAASLDNNLIFTLEKNNFDDKCGYIHNII